MTQINAYHEAGHAFMAILVGARVRSVTIDPDRDDGPERYADTQVEWPLKKFPPKQLRERMVQVALAGPVAEMIHSGDNPHPGFVAEWSSDWRVAWEAAAPLVPDERLRIGYLERVVRQLYQKMNRDENWAAIAAIVDHLDAHETIDGEEVVEIMRTWL